MMVDGGKSLDSCDLKSKVQSGYPHSTVTNHDFCFFKQSVCLQIVGCEFKELISKSPSLCEM